MQRPWKPYIRNGVTFVASKVSKRKKGQLPPPPFLPPVFEFAFALARTRCAPIWVTSFFVWFQIVNETHLYSGRYLEFVHHCLSPFCRSLPQCRKPVFFTARHRMRLRFNLSTICAILSAGAASSVQGAARDLIFDCFVLYPCSFMGGSGFCFMPVFFSSGSGRERIWSGTPSSPCCPS